MIALVFAVAQGYVYPFYHHLTAPVYAHHVPVYHHAPVYNHAPVFTKWPEIVEVEEEDTMEEDAELETTLAPEFEETEEIVTTEAPEEEEVVTERVPVEICKNEGGQLVPCAHGIAPGSAIYAMANAPGYVPTVATAPPAEDVDSVEKRDANPNAEPDDEVRRVFPLLLLFTPPSSELEDIGKFKGIEALSENQS